MNIWNLLGWAMVVMPIVAMFGTLVCISFEDKVFRIAFWGTLLVFGYFCLAAYLLTL